MDARELDAINAGNGPAIFEQDAERVAAYYAARLLIYGMPIIRRPSVVGFRRACKCSSHCLVVFVMATTAYVMSVCAGPSLA